MRANTSEQILDTAMQMVQMRGYNAFSYADVSDVVGIRKASIHYHFPTKSHLGQALVRRYREDLRQSLQKLQAENSELRAQLLGLAEIFEARLQNRCLCLGGILSASMLTLPADVQKEVRSFFAEISAWAADIIKQGCDAGTFSCSAPPEIEAQVLLANIMGAQTIARAAGWPLGDFTKTIERYVASIQA